MEAGRGLFSDLLEIMPDGSVISISPPRRCIRNSQPSISWRVDRRAPRESRSRCCSTAAFRRAMSAIAPTISNHPPRTRTMGHGPGSLRLRKDASDSPEISLSPLEDREGTLVIALSATSASARSRIKFRAASNPRRTDHHRPTGRAPSFCQIRRTRSSSLLARRLLEKKNQKKKPEKRAPCCRMAGTGTSIRPPQRCFFLRRSQGGDRWSGSGALRHAANGRNRSFSPSRSA